MRIFSSIIPFHSPNPKFQRKRIIFFSLLWFSRLVSVDYLFWKSYESYFTLELMASYGTKNWLLKINLDGRPSYAETAFLLTDMRASRPNIP